MDFIKTVQLQLLAIQLSKWKSYSVALISFFNPLSLDKYSNTKIKCRLKFLSLDKTFYTLSNLEPCISAPDKLGRMNATESRQFLKFLQC